MNRRSLAGRLCPAAAALALGVGLLAACGAGGVTATARPSFRRPVPAPTPTWTAAPPLAGSPAPRPTPEPTPILAAAGPFAFVFSYGPCGPLLRLDTAAGTLTRAQVGAAAAASVQLRLTPAELDAIRARLDTIGFFAYPERFSGQPTAGMVTARQPAPEYDPAVREGGRVKRVHWDESIIRPVLPAAAQLRGLGALIEQTIAAHPEAARLPPVSMGCA